MAKAPHGRLGTEPTEADRLLLDLASGLLAEYFFDPDNEARYLALYPARRARADDAPLAEGTLQHDDGSVRWQVEVLGQRNAFRVIVRHPAFAATIEGAWQFQRETLRQGRVIQRTGSPQHIIRTTRSLLDALGSDAPTAEQLSDLLAALSDDQESPLIGDDPQQPPGVTRAERDRVRALVAKISGKPGTEKRIEDLAWLEQTPQTLPVLTDLAVEAMTSVPRDERQIGVCLDLLTQQLEFVRYRVDRGWEWASTMLNEYQQRLIALGQSAALEMADWVALAGALAKARVPVSNDVQHALAEAGITSQGSNALPPEHLLGALRGLTDELAEIIDSPFEVIAALNAAGAMIPATLRGFMTTELALSAHPVLRDAVPLMLLDPDSSVRRAAAAAIEQTAASVSSDSLRRAITARNWIPQTDRADLDRAIRKVRSTGVPIGAWPTALGGHANDSRGDIAFHTSMVDGSGAQSVLASTRGSKKGPVAGLLLKHGNGVSDAWLDQAVSRANINKMLRELKTEVPLDEIDRWYVDTAVQHAIATGLTHGAVPGETLMAIAEAAGGAEWKDRQLDVAAEAERLFTDLSKAERTAQAVEAALERCSGWIDQQPIAASWFEDSPSVRQVIAKVPRKNNLGAAQLVISEILPETRMAWAERFLLMAMWCQAATKKEYRGWAGDFVILSFTLVGPAPLETIPIMNAIALQTVLAARTSGW